MLQKLDFDRCRISEKGFIPNIIRDRNLYDDVYTRAGTATLHVKGTDEKETAEKVVKLFHAMNNGFVHAICGEIYGLEKVFHIDAENIKVKQLDVIAQEVVVPIITLAYAEGLRYTAIEDCIMAAQNAYVLPDSKPYIIIETEPDKTDILESEKEAYVRAMIALI